MITNDMEPTYRMTVFHRRLSKLLFLEIKLPLYSTINDGTRTHVQFIGERKNRKKIHECTYSLSQDARHYQKNPLIMKKQEIGWKTSAPDKNVQYRKIRQIIRGRKFL